MYPLLLSSYPIEQVRDWDSQEREFGSYWAGITYPTRLLAFSLRFRMQPALRRILRRLEPLRQLSECARPLLDAIEAREAGEAGAHADPVYAFGRLDADAQRVLLDAFADDHQLHHALAADTDTAWAAVASALQRQLWPLPWQDEQVRFYQALEQRHLRAASYLLLAWAPPEDSVGAVKAAVQSHIGRQVQRVEQLPAVLPGPYTEQATRLVPEQRGQPFFTVLHAYDARGTWNLSTLHTLLHAPFDVALAIDIQTPPRHRAQRSAELAHTTARMLARDGSLKDARGERILRDADVVLHALTEQNLHDVAISVLVSGETAETLEVNAADIASRLGSNLRLTRIAGVQGELLKFWSATPTHAIAAPIQTRNMLSHAVGCCAGIITFHRASGTAGMLWGLDARRWAPLFLDLFGGDTNQAAHMVILGKTGYGKSWFLNVVTIRAAAIEGWKVVAIDAFRNGERIERAAPGGARCHRIGMGASVNILDWAFDARVDPHALANQVLHAVGQLAYVLGTANTKQGGAFLVPRAFTTDERGVLNRALQRLYADVATDTAPDEMPLLSDLIVELEAATVAEAHAIARSLRLMLFGEEDPIRCTELTTEGQLFNRHTTIDWNFRDPITYYDFSEVQEQWQPLLYAQKLGAFNRYMRSPFRDTRVKTLFIIDEFAFLARIAVVADLAWEISKTARKFGVALLVTDQNPDTFLSDKNNKAILENATAKILFHLDDAPARQMQSVISDLTDDHVRYLTHANPGECIAVFGNDVYSMIVESTPMETRAFAGS